MYKKKKCFFCLKIFLIFILIVNVVGIDSIKNVYATNISSKNDYPKQSEVNYDGKVTYGSVKKTV